MRLQHWFYTIPLRLRSIFRRRQVERDLDEELQYHLDKKIEESLSRGLDPVEARNVALRAMDGLAQRKEECRDARRVNLIDNAMQDLRYGGGRSPARRSEMRRSVLERAFGAMHQLPKSFGTASGFVDQLQSTSGGVETRSPRTLIRVHSREFAAS